LFGYREEEEHKIKRGVQIGDILRYEVLTAMTMQIALFWNATPSSLVEVYERFI
jgi:hypothetical protein